MLKARIRARLLQLMGFKPPVSLEAVDLSPDMLSAVRPVFVLSTGRCGTLWLTRLLRYSDSVHVNHSDYPELIRQSALAYQMGQSNREMFREIVRAARDGYIAQAHMIGQTYVETNNRITFLAEAVKCVYPGARFIHLVRHPGDFVRSGLRRSWYEGAAHDEGRIRFYDDPNAWERLSSIERIAWLWNETNDWIETFLEAQPGEEQLRVTCEAMFSQPGACRSLLDFIGIEDVTDAVIKEMQSRRVNVQRGGKAFPAYRQWGNGEREQVRRLAPLAARYGYDL